MSMLRKSVPLLLHNPQGQICRGRLCFSVGNVLMSEVFVAVKQRLRRRLGPQPTALSTQD